MTKEVYLNNNKARIVQQSLIVVFNKILHVFSLTNRLCPAVQCTRWRPQRLGHMTPWYTSIPVHLTPGQYM